MNTPNKITLTRFIMAIVIVILMVIPFSVWPESMTNPLFDGGFNIVQIITTMLFILAAVSDAIDGHLARKHNLVTNFGKFLDPLADKFLVNSVLIILCACANTGSNKLITHDIIYMFFILDTVLMIGRDIAVDGLRLVASVNGEVIAANIYGKIKTVMQMIVLPILMLGGFPYSLLTLANVSEDVISGISLALLTITCIMSLISGVIYIYRGKKMLKGGK